MTTQAHPRALGRLAFSIASLAATTLTVLADPITVPRGTLNVDSELIRVGAISQLAWNIEYPQPITEIVTIDPTGTIIPKKNVRMKVRVLGVAFQSGSTLLPLDAYWSKNNGQWQNFFYGTGPTVNPSSILIDQQVKINDRIDFGARGWLGNRWGTFSNTSVSSKYVIVLKNGDSAPSYAPAYNQNSVTGFLRPYIDSSGRISIGERDLIILWESSSEQPGSIYFDMQDLVVLATFE